MTQPCAGWRTLLASGALLLSTASAAARAPTFSLQVLGDIPGATDSYVSGINNAGQAVGWIRGAASACPNACPVIWQGATPTLLEPAPGADGYGPLGINNLGQVAGTAVFPDLNSLAVVWIDGTPTFLPAPTSQFYETFAYTINDSGQVVGGVQGGNNLNGGIAVIATTWNGLTPTLLDTPPGCGAESWAEGINNSGLVVGVVECYGYEDTPAVTWRGTTVRLLRGGNENFDEGTAAAVNDRGLIVGSSGNPAGIREAAAWSKGAVTLLGGIASGNYSWATAVNNHGVIVGTATTLDTSGETHAVLWSAVGADIQDLNELIGAALAEQIVLTETTGINDRCQIVANGYDQKKKHGASVNLPFLLTPLDPAACVNGTLTPKPKR